MQIKNFKAKQKIENLINKDWITNKMIKNICFLNITLSCTDLLFLIDFNALLHLIHTQFFLSNTIFNISQFSLCIMDETIVLQFNLFEKLLTRF